MPTRFSAYPLNYDRFVTLTRGAAHTPSPSRELQQMTPNEVAMPAQSHSSLSPSLFSLRHSAHHRNRRRRSCTPRHSHSSLPVVSAIEVIDVDALCEESPSLARRKRIDESACVMSSGTSNDVLDDECMSARTEARASGRPTEPNHPFSTLVRAVSTVGSALGQDTQNDAHDIVVAHRLPGRVRTAAKCLTSRDALSAAHNTESKNDEDEPSTDVVVPRPWNYGSPLYDVITQRHFCWNGHPLQCKTREKDYKDVEGVCCDFCGDTSWRAGVSSGETTEHNTSPSARPTHSAASTRCSLAPPCQNSYFLHCDVCDMDLCALCAHDIATHERFHIPALQCMSCFAYIALHEAAVHSCNNKSNHSRVLGRQTCSVVESSASSAPSSSHATSVMVEHGLRTSIVSTVSTPSDYYDATSEKSVGQTGSASSNTELRLAASHATRTTRNTAIASTRYLSTHSDSLLALQRAECSSRSESCSLEADMVPIASSKAELTPPAATRRKLPATLTRRQPIPRPERTIVSSSSCGCCTGASTAAALTADASIITTFHVQPATGLASIEHAASPPKHTRERARAEMLSYCVTTSLSKSLATSALSGLSCNDPATSTSSSPVHHGACTLRSATNVCCNNTRSHADDNNVSASQSSRTLLPCLWEVYVRVNSSSDSKVLRGIARRYVLYRCRALPEPRTHAHASEKNGALTTKYINVGVVYQARARLEAEQFSASLQDAGLLSIVRPSFSEAHHFMNTIKKSTSTS